MNVYLSVDEVIEIHRILIEEFGGSHGIRDVKLLESAVMRPQSGYYKNSSKKPRHLWKVSPIIIVLSMEIKEYHFLQLIYF